MPYKAQKSAYYYSKGLRDHTLQVYDKNTNRRAIWDLDPQGEKWIPRFPYQGMPDFNDREGRYFSTWRFTRNGTLENWEWHGNNFYLNNKDNSYQLRSEIYTQNQCYENWPPLYIYDAKKKVLARWIWTKEGDAITQFPYEGMPDPNRQDRPPLSTWFGVRSHDWPAKSEAWHPEQGEKTLTTFDLELWKDIKSGERPRNRRWDPELKRYFWAAADEHQEELNAPIWDDIANSQYNREHRQPTRRGYSSTYNPSVNQSKQAQSPHYYCADPLHTGQRAATHFFTPPPYTARVKTTHTIRHTTTFGPHGSMSSTTEHRYTRFNL